MRNDCAMDMHLRHQTVYTPQAKQYLCQTKSIPQRIYSSY